METPPRRRCEHEKPSGWRGKDGLGERGLESERALFVRSDDAEMSKRPIVQPRLMSRAKRTGLWPGAE
ncbi:hypothetical protein LZ31DRAFT_554683 [Colletotrichum somersetense]|nr:hypothetical protein LZ31DRAFT_554683 [Colletotrichum somersetense]